MTQSQVDFILLELTQELDRGTNLLLDLKLEPKSWNKFMKKSEDLKEEGWFFSKVNKLAKHYN